jgi:hypothetical protein
MLDFLKEHFNVLLLAVLALAAWGGAMSLMHTQGMAESNVAWAREQASTIIGALLGLLTGYRLGTASKTESGSSNEDGK